MVTAICNECGRVWQAKAGGPISCPKCGSGNVSVGAKQRKRRKGSDQ